MKEICLLIIYNHRFEKNISKLNEYYKNRFSNIFHIMPFSNTTEDNVISVYENSHQFSGYIAQAFKNFYHQKYSHYVFVGDDLLLHPDINESNIIAILQLKENSSYIKNIFTFHQAKSSWLIPKNLYKFVSAKGINYHTEIPSIDEANQIAKQKGINIQNLNFNFVNNLFKSKGSFLIKDWLYAFGYAVYKKFKHLSQMPYPLVGGYADFVIIAEKNIQLFSKYCGVFAGMNLFAEVAIPTAMMLACDSIQVEQEKWRGKEIWNKAELDRFMKENKNSVKLLFKNHPEYLYFHPAKLSVWSIN